jgi:hypothetical protein
MSLLVVTHLVNHTCNNNFYSKAEYTNTQQDLTVGCKLHHQTLDMKGFWPVEFLCLNSC